MGNDEARKVSENAVGEDYQGYGKVIKLCILESTSPAHAKVAYEDKVFNWKMHCFNQIITTNAKKMKNKKTTKKKASTTKKKAARKDDEPRGMADNTPCCCIMLDGDPVNIPPPRQPPQQAQQAQQAQPLLFERSST